MFSGGVFMLIIDMSEYNWIKICLIISGWIYATVFVVSKYHNIIIMHDDKLYVTGELYKWAEKVQFKDEIKYCDIENISITISSCNSLKKNPQRGFYRPPQFIFFEILLNNGKTKWLHVSYFSNRQKQKILDSLGRKTGILKNYKEMLKQYRASKNQSHC